MSVVTVTQRLHAYIIPACNQ